ncbi:unnamed protein product, partial [Prunus armeniaca]
MASKHQRDVNWKPQEVVQRERSWGTITASYCFLVQDHQPPIFSMEDTICEHPIYSTHRWSLPSIHMRSFETRPLAFAMGIDFVVHKHLSS